MQGLAVALGALLLWSAAAAQTAAELGLTPETLLLARIKVKTEENLKQLPNYTCTQTIERSTRKAPARRFRMLDVLRLEVALVDGKEFFAWPGSERFVEHELRNIVPSGTIGNGEFALHAKSVFLSGWPRFHYVAREPFAGRQCEKFDYSVALPGSGYRLKVNERSAVVAFHGSFWVDAETLDLVRLEVYADNIPLDLGLQSVEQSINYGRTEIGTATFQLPTHATSQITDLDGTENRNETRFSNCHQYAGESFVTFADPPPANEVTSTSEPPPQPSREVQLPADLFLELGLDTPIKPRTAAIGDRVKATLLSKVKRKDSVLVPKGASVSGRIVDIDSFAGDYWRIGIRLEALEFDNQRVPLAAELDGVSGLASGLVSTSPQFPGVSFRVRGLEEPIPGVGVIYVKGGMIGVPRGTRMTWRTVDPAVNGRHQ